jgi:hypothetical protein
VTQHTFSRKKQLKCKRRQKFRIKMPKKTEEKRGGRKRTSKCAVLNADLRRRRKKSQENF